MADWPTGSQAGLVSHLTPMYNPRRVIEALEGGVGDRGA